MFRSLLYHSCRYKHTLSPKNQSNHKLLQSILKSKHAEKELKSIGISRSLLNQALPQYLSSPVSVSLTQSRDNNEDEISRKAVADFIRFIVDSRAELVVVESPLRKNLDNLAQMYKFSDLKSPAFLYPNARVLKRRVYLHVGPTNSGKTFNALKRLRESKSGIYCGPLRLLAHEIYHRMNYEYGVPTRLLTGEEQRNPPSCLSDNASDVPQPATEISAYIRPVAHVSSTVEMANLHSPVEVAVIDEIQMISDVDRGWAWTQAFLGLQAEEIHCCGEVAAVPLLTRLCESIGDELEVKMYQRLNPLKITAPLETFDRVQSGDCVIAFSRKDIFRIKSLIEHETRHKCAVVYGALPPETRAEQARLFNDPESEYKVLVASDAVGMGLNLRVKRIVFSKIVKYDGVQEDLLEPRLLRQIAGRAGRFGIGHGAANGQIDPGEVTTLDQHDFTYLSKCMNMTRIPPIEAACIAPTPNIIMNFHRINPSASLASIIELFEKIAVLDKDYVLADLETMKKLADYIEPFDLEMPQRCVLINAPVRYQNPVELSAYIEMVQAYSRSLKSQWSKKVFRFEDLTLSQQYLDCAESFRSLDRKQFTSLFKRESHTQDDKSVMMKLMNGIWPVPLTQESLLEYEAIHRISTLYLWIHYRFPESFPSFYQASSIKTHMETCINKALDRLTQSEAKARGYEGLLSVLKSKGKKTKNRSRSR